MARFAFLLLVLMITPVSAQGAPLQLIGCDQFLENAKPDEYGECHLSEPVLAQLKFKSRLHELSFFWGYAVPGFLHCERIIFRLLSRRRPAGPYDILWGYVESKLGHSLDRLGNARIDPYIWAKWSGQYAGDWFIEHKGKQRYCIDLMKALGPSGRVARWMSRY